MCWRRCGSADLLLVGLRHHRDVLEAVVGAFIRKARLGPRALENVENFAKAVAALRVGDAVGFIGLRHPAAADPEDQPSVAQLIDRRGFLGQPQRMAQRQDLDRDADLDAARARGDRAGDAERRRQHRAPRLEVEFGEPYHIEPPAFRGVDLLERLVEGVALGSIRERRKLVKHAEFHDPASIAASLVSTAA